MRHGFEQSLTEVAHWVAQFPLVKKVLQPLYYFVKENNRKAKNRQFRNYGLDALIQFDKCFQENHLYYTLAFGTMLGAIREHGFIPHDLDIDVLMFAEDYSDDLHTILEKYGFKLSHTFLVDDGLSGREETYLYNGVSMDVFFFYPPIDKYPYCCDFLMKNGTSTFRESMRKHGCVLPRRIELPITKERVKVPFEGINLYVPKNSNEILSFRYGDDYMIPNSNWDIKSHDSHIVEWEEKEGIFKDYE